MTDPLTRFLSALDRLPPLAAVSYRGCPEGVSPPTEMLVTRGLNATSLNPAVASEGWAHKALFAVAGITGRLLGELSAHPAELEVVLLPGSALVPRGSVPLYELGLLVYLWEEIAVRSTGGEPTSGLPATGEAFAETVALQVRAAAVADAAPVAARGKYAGPLI